ncbi:MAG: M20/M25/M40 family metallo-hydrolase [Acidobacteria bacterium]|nr:M20/M25/M40 family metallo-hydrolase [Acidobacteriota bacterium]
MDHLFYLTDVHGPRLTNSPGFHKAADWVVKRSKEMGLANAALEPWGKFGRGWSSSRVSAHLIEPGYAPLIAVPLSWTPGTNGVLTGTPIIATLEPSQDVDEYQAAIDKFMAKYKGKLRDQMLLYRPLKKLEPQDKAASTRYSADQLRERAEAPEPVEPIDINMDDPHPPSDPEERRRFNAYAPAWVFEQTRVKREVMYRKLYTFLKNEGVRLLIYPASAGDGGTIFPPTAGSAYQSGFPLPPPSIALTPEHYNRLMRLVEKKQPVKIEVEVQAQFYENPVEAANVVAELPGGAKRDEVVIIGGHLDSWDFGTGATDNAAGCAVMMEAMRILKTLDLKMDRTVRLVLWSGEEQGLFGSEGYVKNHYADTETMKLLPEHGKVSAYYNLDNGTGKIRGVYLQGNDMVRPTFDAWLSPFRDLGATTLSIRNTGGTDHLSFDAVGIPGFQFIQDQVEYNSRTHHSNMDVYDRIVPADLMQAAAIIASFVYHTANRPEPLPRKPLPKPGPRTVPVR